MAVPCGPLLCHATQKWTSCTLVGTLLYGIGQLL